MPICFFYRSRTTSFYCICRNTCLLAHFAFFPTTFFPIHACLRLVSYFQLWRLNCILFVQNNRRFYESTSVSFGRCPGMVFYFFCMQISCLEMSACCLYSFCKVLVFFTFCPFSFPCLTICLCFICLPVLYNSLSVYLPRGFSSHLYICVPVHFLPVICLPVEIPPDHLPPLVICLCLSILVLSICLVVHLPTSICAPVNLPTCLSAYPPIFVFACQSA